LYEKDQSALWRAIPEFSRKCFLISLLGANSLGLLLLCRQFELYFKALVDTV